MSIKEDAARWAYAKLEHGEGAGNLRKKVWASLSEKMKNPDYAIKFQEALDNINMSKIQNRVDRIHTAKNVVNSAKLFKKVLAVFGISAGTIIPYYLTHKPECDKIIKIGLRKAKYRLNRMKLEVYCKITDLKLFFKDKFHKKSYKDRIDPKSFNDVKV